MNTPEERREAQARALAPVYVRKLYGKDEPVVRCDTRDASEFLDAFVKHFEDTDQKPVADAIRYGLSQEKLDTATAMSLNFWTLDDIIDYPSEEDPSPDPSDIADLRADERRANEK